MGFILVHQISKKGREDIPHLIAVKEIITVTISRNWRDKEVSESSSARRKPRSGSDS